LKQSNNKMAAVHGVLQVFSKEATAELLEEVKDTFNIWNVEADDLVTIAKEFLTQGGAKLKPFKDQIEAIAKAREAYEVDVGLFGKIGFQRSKGGTNYGMWTASQIEWCDENLDRLRLIARKGLPRAGIVESKLESALLEMEVDGGKLNETSVTLAIEKCVFKSSEAGGKEEKSKLQASQKLFHEKDRIAQAHSSRPKQNTRNLAEALIFFYQYQEQQDATQKVMPAKFKFNEIDSDYMKQLQLQKDVARVDARKMKAKKKKKVKVTGVDIKVADKRKDRESQADGTPGFFDNVTPEYLASLNDAKKEGLTVWVNEWAKSNKIDGETEKGKIVELRFTDPEDDKEKKITNITMLMTFLTTTLDKYEEPPSLDLHIRWGVATATPHFHA